MDYKKWMNHTFTSYPDTGKDYIEFQKDMRLDLKKQALLYNFELHSFSKNHYCFSAVLKDKDSGRFIYVSMSDVRGMKSELFNCVLYRTMKHEKDWTGGNNKWCCWQEIGKKCRELVEWTKRHEQNQEIEQEIER